MKSHRIGDGERSLAVFIDFENMGLGFNNRRDRFEISKVLERLVEKGKIVCKKAYADWSRFGTYTGALHEAAIELIEIPRRGITGKNSADIRLVVDAIDLAYSKDHIDTFCIVSGDSDFSPLVSKLKELGKHVIGLGLVDATSDLLRDNCDEFIYYEDLDRAPIIPVATNEALPERKRKVFALVLDSLLALRRENKEVIFSSMLKDTIKRKKPSFNEDYFGYRTFSELLEDAQKEGLLEIEKHKSSGMYVVTRFGLEMKSGVLPLPVRSGNGEARRVVDLPKPPVVVLPVVRPPAPIALPAAKPPMPPAPVSLPAAKQPVAPAPERTEKREPVRPRPPEQPAARPPARPAPPLLPARLPARPAQPHKQDEDEDRLLGRALVDEIEELDDDDDFDEVPSYAPSKPAKPAQTAPKPVAVKPSVKPPVKPPAKPAPKPITPLPPQGKSSPKPAAKPKPAPPPKPAPKPFDEDDFGSGVD